jgi:hypothetical protein
LDQWWSSICSTDTIAIRSKCDGAELLFNTFERDPGERRSRPLGLYDDAKARMTSACRKSRKSSDPKNPAKGEFWTSLLLPRFQRHYGGP